MVEYLGSGSIAPLFAARITLFSDALVGLKTVYKNQTEICSKT
jgi:hypothetical protein